MEHCLYSIYDLLSTNFQMENFNLAIQKILNNENYCINDFPTKIVYLYDATKVENDFTEFDKTFFIALFCRRNNLLTDLQTIVENYNGEYKEYLLVLLNNPICKDLTYIHSQHQYKCVQEFEHYLNKKFLYGGCLND